MGHDPFGNLIFGKKQKPSHVSVTVPEKTKTEKELLALQLEQLKKLNEPPSEEELLARQKQQEYLDQLIAEGELSPEEEAMFEKEYELQLANLEEVYTRESKKIGASDIADLAGRGVLDTTTGTDFLTERGRQMSEVFLQQRAELGKARQLAKSDMEAAKQEMAMRGYALTSGLLQTKMNTALEAAAQAQAYTGRDVSLQASGALQNALLAQARNRAIFQQEFGHGVGWMNTGMGVMKMGAMG